MEEDMTENKDIIFENEETMRAVLVGVAIKGKISEEECMISLGELERLLDTAGGVMAARLIQSKDNPDVRTYIGSGKLDELKMLCSAYDAGLVVFDAELSPSQIRNIEDALDGVEVIDRSMLILDIFALHANSGEGKLQVELAQLRYTAPRLAGRGRDMSRLGGGIGTRGPGESKLESDRRHIERRINSLESELAELEKSRRVMRAARDRSGLTKVAIVGYTNAGKSTLMNRLTNAGVLAQDKLFATLDPTTRRLELPCGETVLLTDTVGFIRNLPHHLIKAFKSTLDEAVYSDIIVILCDASDPECASQLQVTTELLSELGASDKPIIYAFNKIDCAPENFSVMTFGGADRVFLSAKSGRGVDDFVAAIEKILLEGKRECTLLIPYGSESNLDKLYRTYTVVSVDYLDNGISVKAVLDSKGRGMFGEFIIKD
jgi:GTP-binding protein HflX